MMNEHRDLNNKIIELLEDRLGEDTAFVIANEIMNEVSENFRSISEIHTIVAAVRAGEEVQIDYYNEDEDNEYTVKACW